VGLVTACELVFPLGEYASLPLVDASVDETRRDGPAEDGGPDASIDASRCPSREGLTTMIDIGAFCIDSTEVTEGQYGAFLDDPDVSVNDTNLLPKSFCGWKMTSNDPGFAPDHLDSECSMVKFDPVGHADYPVNCVDWCDAYAFCKWAGRRLCGNADAGSAGTINEWVYACSRDGNLPYPYGAAYEATVCNGADYGQGAALPVSRPSSCMGGYPGVLDMSGNVDEWIDDCTGSGGPKDPCGEGGGNYLSDAGDLACNANRNTERYYAEPIRGFRCCSP
jgi:formylglycine-generating enzyme